MTFISCRRFMAVVVLVGVVGAATCKPSVEGSSAAAASQQNTLPPPGTATAPDLSGCERTGTASFYAKMFTGRKMADGTRMDPNADNAASRTLPLGTTAGK